MAANRTSTPTLPKADPKLADPTPTGNKPAETPTPETPAEPAVRKFVPCEGKGKPWGGNVETREVTCPDCGTTAIAMMVNFRDTKNGIQPATVPNHRVAKDVPVKASASAAKGESQKAAAKNLLAKVALDSAFASVVAILDYAPKDGEEPNADSVAARNLLAALGDKNSVLQILANLTHHFPTAKTESGKRYRPAGTPLPDRSDWK